MLLREISGQGAAARTRISRGTRSGRPCEAGERGDDGSSGYQRDDERMPSEPKQGRLLEVATSGWVATVWTTHVDREAAKMLRGTCPSTRSSGTRGVQPKKPFESPGRHPPQQKLDQLPVCVMQTRSANQRETGGNYWRNRCRCNPCYGKGRRYPVQAVVISTTKSRRESTSVQSRQSFAGGSIVLV
jgi:hypothetical protein